jgi:integrase
MAIDSKLRSCYLVKLRVSDVAHGKHILKRAMVIQQKTQRPVQFEITDKTRTALSKWIDQAKLSNSDFLFKGQTNSNGHISTRQYARIVKNWGSQIGLNLLDYGTHSIRRTKATLIYRRTKSLRAIQLLLGHTKLESTVRYLGIEVDDALEMSEQTDC